MTTLPKNVEHFDRHGFAVFTGGAGPHSERDHAYNRSETHDAQYLAAWQKLLDSWEVHDSIGSTKLETFVKQGIPAELRPAVWKSLLEMESLKSTSKFEYQVEIHAVREQLIDLGISEYSGIKATNGLSDAEMDTYEVKFGQISMDSLRHILLDLDRTYPTHRKYMGQTGEAKEGKAALFRILAAYARYNPSVGYCQGMSSIAGLFLMYLPEEDAFWCFVSLLERHKYLLGYYNHHMQRIQKHARVFEQLLTQRYPRLQSHLEALGVCALMFIPPWFISLYTSLPCWDSVLAIWDLLLLHGNKTMFRVALAIMSLIESDLLQADELGTLLPQILHPLPARINYSRLVHTIWSLSMEDWEITSLMAVLEEEEVKELGRRRAKEEVKEPDSMKRSSKRKRIDSSDDPPVKSWFSKVFSAFSGPPSMDDTNSRSLFHRAAKRQKSPTIDPKPTTRSSAFTRSSGRFVQHSKGSSAISSQQLKALHHDPCSGSRGMSWSSLVTSDQQSTGATRRSTQVTAQYLKRRLERKSGHKTVLIEHHRRLHVSPCEEVKENSSVQPTLCAASQARQLNKLLHCNSFRQASVQHSFKAFHTPKPLRVTQHASSQTVPASHTLLSPEVELQSVRTRKSYSAQS